MCNPVVGAKVIEPFDRFLAFINTPDNFEGLFRLAKIVGITNGEIAIDHNLVGGRRPITSFVTLAQ
jgi:hypothetical protein